MTEDHEHPFDDLAAHVLQALDGPERARLEAHLATCSACQGHLADYRAVADTLPTALDPVAPPPGAWAAIQAAARQARPPRRERRPTWRRVVWPVVGALAASLLVWNVALQYQLAGRGAVPDVEKLARRPGRVAIFAGVGAPGASARLFVAVDKGHAHLAVAGLRPLPPGRTYQLWFVRPDAPALTGGTFRVDARGIGWAAVDVPITIEQTEAITVTEEPASGSPAPTGPTLLESRPWR